MSARELGRSQTVMREESITLLSRTGGAFTAGDFGIRMVTQPPAVADDPVDRHRSPTYKANAMGCEMPLSFTCTCPQAPGPRRWPGIA